MKKYKMLIALFLSTLMICFSAGCENAEEIAPTLVQQNVNSIEVGEKISDFTTFFTCLDGAAIELGDLSEIDTNTVGTYDIPTIIHYKKVAIPMNYPLEVIDTTPPELKVDKTSIDLFVGMTYSPEKLIKATATDNSGEEVDISFRSFPMITDKALKSSGKVIATDPSGNSVSTDIDVNIKNIETETDLYSYLNTIILSDEQYKNVIYDSRVIEGLSIGGKKYYDDETIITLGFPVTELIADNKNIVAGYCVDLEITDQRAFAFTHSAYYLQFQPFLRLRFQKDYQYMTTEKVVIKSSSGSTECVGSPFNETSLKIEDDLKTVLYGDNPTLVVDLKDKNEEIITVTIPLSSTDIDTIKNAFKLQKTINQSIPMY